MLTDPQSITVSAVAQSMPKVSSSGTASNYSKADGTFGLSIRHTPKRIDGKQRVKHLVVFSQKAIVPDPLTTVNDYETVNFSVQIDRPLAGFTSAQIQAMVTGFNAWLTSTIVDKLYGMES
jgi:hypothetical protein